jgi:hypothetical protein
LESFEAGSANSRFLDAVLLEGGEETSRGVGSKGVVTRMDGVGVVGGIEGRESVECMDCGCSVRGVVVTIETSEATGGGEGLERGNVTEVVESVEISRGGGVCFNCVGMSEDGVVCVTVDSVTIGDGLSSGADVIKFD